MNHRLLRASALNTHGLSALSIRERADALRYENSLADFTAAAWRLVEPKAFLGNWHIDAVCEHLEAIADWQIQRGLLINIPPRHMKSLGANVFFPAWVWAQAPNPDHDPNYKFQVRRNSWRGPGVKFMHLSYDSTLAIRDGVKCRQIITSPWYQRLWGHRFQMRPDQNQKTRFDNLCGGHRISTSEGGMITGEGADVIVFDDPHNVRDIGGASDVARETTLRFWDEAMPSRLNDQDHGVFIVIMQRVHERDLSGHILANELGWTHLCLPAVYEPNHPFPTRSTVKRKATGEIWTDPRQEGEPLWPERFSREALQRIAKDEAMSSHTAAGQLQQRPTAREGGLFKRQWFANPVKFAPPNLRLVRSWDFASSVTISNDPDWTVGLLMGLDPNTRLLYVLDVIRARLTPGQREQRVRSTGLLDGDDVRIRIPQDPGGAGKFEAHHFASILQGYSVSIEPEQGTKERRADPFAAQCEHGFVKLVEGSWNKAFVDELCAFPNGAHDDQVDAVSAAFRTLVKRRGGAVAIGVETFGSGRPPT
jgi:predicted phage terminase large subunit-like protein